jgi:hypothetical protein
VRSPVKRSVSVYNDDKSQFVRLLLTACADTKATINRNPYACVETKSGGSAIHLNYFADFGSIAEHKERHFRQFLKTRLHCSVVSWPFKWLSRTCSINLLSVWNRVDFS